MASDDFNGSAVALATHNPAWKVSTYGDPISNLGIDGSGFLINNGAFAEVAAYFDDGTTGPADKSEMVFPIGYFSAVNSARAGPNCCTTATTQGFNCYPEDGGTQVVGTVRVASNASFLATLSLAPTINTAAVTLTISIQRISTTVVRVIVNGTVYNVNSTGFDLTTGFPAVDFARNSATATSLKVESWTNGAVSISGSGARISRFIGQPMIRGPL